MSYYQSRTPPVTYHGGSSLPLSPSLLDKPRSFAAQSSLQLWDHSPHSLGKFTPADSPESSNNHSPRSQLPGASDKEDGEDDLVGVFKMEFELPPDGSGGGGGLSLEQRQQQNSPRGVHTTFSRHPDSPTGYFGHMNLQAADEIGTSRSCPDLSQGYKPRLPMHLATQQPWLSIPYIPSIQQPPPSMQIPISPQTHMSPSAPLSPQPTISQHHQHQQAQYHQPTSLQQQQQQQQQQHQSSYPPQYPQQPTAPQYNQPQQLRLAQTKLHSSLSRSDGQVPLRNSVGGSKYNNSLLTTSKPFGSSLVGDPQLNDRSSGGKRVGTSRVNTRPYAKPVQQGPKPPQTHPQAVMSNSSQSSLASRPRQQSLTTPQQQQMRQQPTQVPTSLSQHHGGQYKQLQIKQTRQDNNKASPPPGLSSYVPSGYPPAVGTPPGLAYTSHTAPASPSLPRVLFNPASGSTSQSPRSPPGNISIPSHASRVQQQQPRSRSMEREIHHANHHMRNQSWDERSNSGLSWHPSRSNHMVNGSEEEDSGMEESMSSSGASTPCNPTVGFFQMHQGVSLVQPVHSSVSFNGTTNNLSDEEEYEPQGVYPTAHHNYAVATNIPHQGRSLRRHSSADAGCEYATTRKYHAFSNSAELDSDDYEDSSMGESHGRMLTPNHAGIYRRGRDVHKEDSSGSCSTSVTSVRSFGSLKDLQENSADTENSSSDGLSSNNNPSHNFANTSQNHSSGHQLSVSSGTRRHILHTSNSTSNIPTYSFSLNSINPNNYHPLTGATGNSAANEVYNHTNPNNNASSKKPRPKRHVSNTDHRKTVEFPRSPNSEGFNMGLSKSADHAVPLHNDFLDTAVISLSEQNKLKAKPNSIPVVTTNNSNGYTNSVGANGNNTNFNVTIETAPATPFPIIIESPKPDNPAKIGDTASSSTTSPTLPKKRRPKKKASEDSTSADETADNPARASIEDFLIDIDAILSGSETRASLMIRNIPNKYSRDMLLETFNTNFKRSYDFFYLPIDFKNKCNVGYAFINFIKTRTVADFFSEFNAKRWARFNSTKVCSITFARIQGKQNCIEHFRNSTVQNEVHDYRPLIFHSVGERVGLEEEFPAPNAAIPVAGKNAKVRTSGSKKNVLEQPSAESNATANCTGTTTTTTTTTSTTGTTTITNSGTSSVATNSSVGTNSLRASSTEDLSAESVSQEVVNGNP